MVGGVQGFSGTSAVLAAEAGLDEEATPKCSLYVPGRDAAVRLLGTDEKIELDTGTVF